MFDTKSVVVEVITQEMLDWLGESEMKYITQPNLIRWRYSGCMGHRNGDLIKTSKPKSDYRKSGMQIIFEEDKDRFEFALVFGEQIRENKKGMFN